MSAYLPHRVGSLASWCSYSMLSLRFPLLDEFDCWLSVWAADARFHVWKSKRAWLSFSIQSNLSCLVSAENQHLEKITSISIVTRPVRYWYVEPVVTPVRVKVFVLLWNTCCKIMDKTTTAFSTFSSKLEGNFSVFEPGSYFPTFLFLSDKWRQHLLNVCSLSHETDCNLILTGYCAPSI